MKISAGVVKDLTEYASGKAGPFWIDSNLIRFINGYAEKIGGWAKNKLYGTDASNNADYNTETTLTGIARSMLLWRAESDGEDRIVVGTHNHLYIIENDAIYDITPARKTTLNLTNPLATTDESATITITDNSHGALVGDWVVINSATATGGITADNLNRTAGYQIQSVPSVHTYTITAPTDATSSVASGGGTAIDITYLIGIDNKMGTQTASPALGWGVGKWNDSTWGTPRSAGASDVVLEHSVWSLNLWGEDVIATVRGDASYYWDTSVGTGTRASLVSAQAGASGVPAKIRTTSISFPDRHFILGGTVALGGSVIDPMLVRWSDQESFIDYTPTASNTSGDKRLEIGTKIMAMQPTRDETLIFTDEATYSMTFIGAPFIFSFRLLATGTGAGGKRVAGDVDGTVYWMAKDRFFKYDGIVKELTCPVQHYVFDRMQQNYIDKSFIAHNRKFKEVSWFYVSTSNSDTAGNPEPDSYVTYNYGEKVWYIGSMDRTIWHDSFGFRKVPFAFDSSGYLYEQETGTDANGSSMSCHIESSDMELSQSGDNLFMIDKIIPDTTLTEDTNLYIEMKSRKYPNATEVSKGPFTIDSDTTKLSTRAKGRQIAFKLYSTGSTDSWSLGDFRVNIREDGLR